jgi:basic membrane protein A
VNPDAVVTVTYVSGAPDTAAFNDPAGGLAVAQQMLAQDPEIDVIFAPAGKTGNGGIQAACDAGIWAIGFDVDQSQSLPEYAGCIVTSAEKKLANSVQAAIEKIGAGEDQGGVLFLDITTNDVGISSFHDHADAVSDEAVAAVEAATAAMLDGSMVTCEAQEGTGFCVQTLP